MKISKSIPREQKSILNSIPSEQKRFSDQHTSHNKMSRFQVPKKSTQILKIWVFNPFFSLTGLKWPEIYLNITSKLQIWGFHALFKIKPKIVFGASHKLIWIRDRRVGGYWEEGGVYWKLVEKLGFNWEKGVFFSKHKEERGALFSVHPVNSTMRAAEIGSRYFWPGNTRLVWWIICSLFNTQ